MKTYFNDLERLPVKNHQLISNDNDLIITFYSKEVITKPHTHTHNLLLKDYTETQLGDPIKKEKEKIISFFNQLFCLNDRQSGPHLPFFT